MSSPAGDGADGTCTSASVPSLGQITISRWEKSLWERLPFRVFPMTGIAGGRLHRG